MTQASCQNTATKALDVTLNSALNSTLKDPFAQLLGITTLEATWERSVCQMTLTADHNNALGGTHGGVLFALADIAFAVACNAGTDTYIGLQAEMRYMNPVKGQRITATATRVSGSKKISHYQVLVTDEQARKIALFTASAYCLGQR